MMKIASNNRAANGSSRNQQKDAAENLASSQEQPDEIGRVGSGKIVRGARQNKQHGLDQDHGAESPLQNGQSDSRFHQSHEVLSLFSFLDRAFARRFGLDFFQAMAG